MIIQIQCFIPTRKTIRIKTKPILFHQICTRHCAFMNVKVKASFYTGQTAMRPCAKSEMDTTGAWFINWNTSWWIQSNIWIDFAAFGWNWHDAHGMIWSQNRCKGCFNNVNCMVTLWCSPILVLNMWVCEVVCAYF